MALLKPLNILDDGRYSGFDTVMIAIDGGIVADPGIGETTGLLFRYEKFDILVQRSLITFQSQHVIGFLLEDRFGDIALEPHRIDDHDGSLMTSMFSSFGIVIDIVGLFRNLDLTEHQWNLEASVRSRDTDDATRSERDFIEASRFHCACVVTLSPGMMTSSQASSPGKNLHPIPLDSGAPSRCVRFGDDR